jgi:hypothetical protein
MTDLPVPMPPEAPDAETPRASLESYPFWNYHDLLLFLAMGIPCMLLSAALVMGILVTVPGAAPRKALILLPAQFLGYALWFLCLYLILKTRYNRPFWPAMKWTAPVRGLGGLVLYGPVVAFFIALLAVLMRTPQVDLPIRELLKDWTSIVLVGIFAVTLGPVAEELAFRGFLMPLLMRSTGTALGILLTSLPFAALHGPQYGWSWQHILLLTIAGCAFGWIRVRSDSTMAAAITHATYNLTFFVAYVLQLKDIPATW